MMVMKGSGLSNTLDSSFENCVNGFSASDTIDDDRRTFVQKGESEHIFVSLSYLWTTNKNKNKTQNQDATTQEIYINILSNTVCVLLLFHHIEFCFLNLKHKFIIMKKFN